MSNITYLNFQRKIGLREIWPEYKKHVLSTSTISNPRRIISIRLALCASHRLRVLSPNWMLPCNLGVSFLAADCHVYEILIEFWISNFHVNLIQDQMLKDYSFSVL